MSNKKKSIQVKLELKGELKELVESESTREFRSCTQQVYYILNKYYKEGFGTQKSKMYTNEELLETNSEYKEPLVTNNEIDEPKSEKYNTTSTEEYELSTNYEAEECMINSDVLDF